jgi:hypothetical protein
MPGYSTECQPIANKITGLRSEVASFQKQLQTAPPGAKPELLSQIEKLNSQIAQQTGLLNECVKEHPYHPLPPPPKNPCLSIQAEVNQLQKTLDDEIEKALAPLQKQLQTAPSGEKPGLLHQIQVIRQQYMASPLAKEITAKENAYIACIKSHGGLLAMDAHFKGKATMTTTNSHAPGPFKQDVNITLHFGDWDHSKVTVMHFPPVSVTYDTHSIAGTVTTTVTMQNGAGYYDPQNHSISITLDLFFHHNTSLAGDSTLHITLGSSGPIAADGSVDAFGGGTFKGGFLGDDECSIDVKGKIEPRP